MNHSIRFFYLIDSLSMEQKLGLHRCQVILALLAHWRTLVMSLSAPHPLSVTCSDAGQLLTLITLCNPSEILGDKTRETGLV